MASEQAIDWRAAAIAVRQKYRELYSEAVERDCRHIEDWKQISAFYLSNADARIAALEAEVAALRGALTVIERKADVARLGLLWKGPQWLRITEAMELARAALAAAAARDAAGEGEFTITVNVDALPELQPTAHQCSNCPDPEMEGPSMREMLDARSNTPEAGA